MEENGWTIPLRAQHLHTLSSPKQLVRSTARFSLVLERSLCSISADMISLNVLSLEMFKYHLRSNHFITQLLKLWTTIFKSKSAQKSPFLSFFTRLLGVKSAKLLTFWSFVLSHCLQFMVQDPCVIFSFHWNQQYTRDSRAFQDFVVLSGVCGEKIQKQRLMSSSQLKAYDVMIHYGLV